MPDRVGECPICFKTFSKHDKREVFCSSRCLDKHKYRNYRTKILENSKKRFQKNKERLCRKALERRRRDMANGNTEKHIARQYLNNRIAAGLIKRPTSCECCHITCKPDAHHDDYKQKTKVRWLCRSCHRYIERDVIPQTKAELLKVVCEEVEKMKVKEDNPTLNGEALRTSRRDRGVRNKAIDDVIEVMERLFRDECGGEKCVRCNDTGIWNGEPCPKCNPVWSKESKLLRQAEKDELNRSEIPNSCPHGVTPPEYCDACSVPFKRKEKA